MTIIARRSVEQSLKRYAAALNETGTAADKVRIHLAIFGKGSLALMNVFKGGPEAIDEMIAKAGQLGPVTQESIGEVREAMRAYREFQYALTGIGRSLAVIFTPVFKTINEGLAALAGSGASGLAGNIQFFRVLVEVAMDVWRAFEEVRTAILEWLIPGLGLMNQAIASNGMSWESFRSTALEALYAVQFAAKNWKDAMTFALNWVGLKLVELVNRVIDSFSIITKALEAFGVDNPFKGLAEKLQAELKKADFRGKLQDFVDEKMKKFNEKPKPDVLEKGSPLQAIGARPAAMDIGSKEAFSVVAGQHQDKMLHAAWDQLKENKKQVKLLEKLLKNLYGVKLAKAKL